MLHEEEPLTHIVRAKPLVMGKPNEASLVLIVVWLLFIDFSKVLRFADVQAALESSPVINNK